jgi:hypothetical protein
MKFNATLIGAQDKADLSTWAREAIRTSFHGFSFCLSIFLQIKALLNSISTRATQETEIQHLCGFCLDLHPAHLAPA